MNIAVSVIVLIVLLIIAGITLYLWEQRVRHDMERDLVARAWKEKQATERD